MTSGPAHYEAAEGHLADAEAYLASLRAYDGDDPADTAFARDVHCYHLGAAQVHATLALAAATALQADTPMPTHDGAAWRAVAAIPPPKDDDDYADVYSYDKPGPYSAGDDGDLTEDADGLPKSCSGCPACGGTGTVCAVCGGMTEPYGHSSPPQGVASKSSRSACRTSRSSALDGHRQRAAVLIAPTGVASMQASNQPTN